ncbi:hypothetical protein KQX63_13320 [Rhodopseudomonas palustris]|uniref:hypothetical protein n=1 Tax=Rhodopseudomonas palustris TaxID=1076 RepID=UPI0021F3745C|nr:hypothetical protein [Rhodopseudomonas palustris]UYO42391.1 hypothetical protein KQX63_13320 [Rhodopseudomonas palustris]
MHEVVSFALIRSFHPNERHNASHKTVVLADALSPHVRCGRTLRIVARHAQRSLADIIQLIIDRNVRWVGRLPKLKGIEAIVLKLDEVKALARGPAVDGLPAVPASRVVQITAPVLREIARRGIIKTIQVVDPVNRCPRILFPLAELERFGAEYISLYNLSVGRSTIAVRKELAAQGIKPAEGLSGLDATFYKRSDLNL